MYLGKISELKKQADACLRTYLLKTSKKQGERYYCPIKKKYFPKQKMNVSHFIDRGCMHLRYDLRNCHLISEQSNQWDAQIIAEGYKSLHHKEYEEYLGQKVVSQLKEESKIIRVLKREDYEKIIESFCG